MRLGTLGTWGIAACLSVVAALLLVTPSPGVGGRAAGTGRDDSVIDLGRRVAIFTATLREDAPYRPPNQTESDIAARTIDLLSQGDPDTHAHAAEILGPVGFTVESGVDARTGRPITVIASEPGSERAWGLYVVDTSQPADVVVEVPHPASDLRTEVIGVALFQAAPGGLFAMAGTHRKVGNGAGDVAHRADSMFHIVTEALAVRHLPQLQLHGFDNQSLPGFDLVLSPGATKATAALRATAGRLTEGGLAVCPAWKQDCGSLEGKRNEQGIAAARHGSEFAHVEMNRTTRDSDHRWGKVVAALDAEYPAS